MNGGEANYLLSQMFPEGIAWTPIMAFCSRHDSGGMRYGN